MQGRLGRQDSEQRRVETKLIFKLRNYREYLGVYIRGET